MFDHPFTDPSRVSHEELTPTNLAAARNTAAESLVLLRNQNKALPVATSTSSIAVVGPLADNAPDQLGSNLQQYNVSVAHTVTVLQGIKNAVPHATIQYAQGCDALCTSTSGFNAAVQAANSSR